MRKDFSKVRKHLDFQYKVAQKWITEQNEKLKFLDMIQESFGAEQRLSSWTERIHRTFVQESERREMNVKTCKWQSLLHQSLSIKEKIFEVRTQFEIIEMTEKLIYISLNEIKKIIDKSFLEEIAELEKNKEVTAQEINDQIKRSKKLFKLNKIYKERNQNIEESITEFDVALSMIEAATTFLPESEMLSFEVTSGQVEKDSKLTCSRQIGRKWVGSPTSDQQLNFSFMNRLKDHFVVLRGIRDELLNIVGQGSDSELKKCELMSRAFERFQHARDLISQVSDEPHFRFENEGNRYTLLMSSDLNPSSRLVGG